MPWPTYNHTTGFALLAFAQCVEGGYQDVLLLRIVGGNVPDGPSQLATIIVYQSYTITSTGGSSGVPRIEALEIEDYVLDKIESKHGVSFEEIEVACLAAVPYVRRDRRRSAQSIRPDERW